MNGWHIAFIVLCVYVLALSFAVDAELAKRPKR